MVGHGPLEASILVRIQAPEPRKNLDIAIETIENEAHSGSPFCLLILFY